MHAGQGGHSHINEQTNQYVIDLFTRMGYTYDEGVSMQARESAKYAWFKKTVMLFRKN